MHVKSSLPSSAVIRVLCDTVCVTCKRGPTARLKHKITIGEGLTPSCVHVQAPAVTLDSQAHQVRWSAPHLYCPGEVCIYKSFLNVLHIEKSWTSWPNLVYMLLHNILCTNKHGHNVVQQWLLPLRLILGSFVSLQGVMDRLAKAPPGQLGQSVQQERKVIPRQHIL